MVEKRSRKIDLDKIIDRLLKEVRSIDASDKPQMTKTQSHRRAAEKALRALFGTRQQKSVKALTLNTAHKYLTKIRNAVTEQGWRHHSLEASLERLASKYPAWEAEVTHLERLPLTDTRLSVKHLKDKLLDSAKVSKVLSAMDPEAPRLATRVNQVAKDFPEWAPELLPIKGVDAAAALQVANDKLAQAQALFNDLGGLKIDHEVMRWLVKDSFAVHEQNRASGQALTRKKNRTIAIRYPSLMAHMEMLLTAPSPPWEALATGVALATGRRAVEVLVQGRFTRVDSHRLKFSGQAKERGGVDYDNEFEIYSLLPTDMVLEALDRLRSSSKVAGLVDGSSLPEESRHYQPNELVHNRTAAPLNDFMRRFMVGAEQLTGIDGREWVFRDARAIYTAVCFDRFFDSDPRWAEKSIDVFFTELLGHGDDDSQKYYKQFKVLEGGKAWQKIELGDKDRLAELEKFDEAVSSRAALARLHNAAKDAIKADPEASITGRLLRASTGARSSVTKEYMELVADALHFDTSLDQFLASSEEVEKARLMLADEAAEGDSGADEQAELAELADDKPKVMAFPIDAGWDVIIEVGGHVRHRQAVEGGSKLAAMRQAWEAWQAPEQPKAPRLPAAMPKPRVSKRNGGWLVQVFHGGEEVVGIWQKGSQGDAIRSAQRAYQDELDKQQ
jgi:hypothetical protein